MKNNPTLARLALTFLLLLPFLVSPLGSAILAREPEPPPTEEDPGPRREPDQLAGRWRDPDSIGPGWGPIQDPGQAIQGGPSLAASGAAQVALGLGHSCALTDAGGVRCWGDNYLGQLGDGSATTRYTPDDVISLATGVVAVDSLHKHSCAVTDQGGVKCWGYNLHGEIGDGTTFNRHIPVYVPGLTSGVVEVAVGGFHTCALTAVGAVKCWGANWHGQVGDGTTQQRLTPVDVVGLDTGVVAITAGKFHSCALIFNGRVKCWGYNRHGELGDGLSTDRLTPIGVWAITGGVVQVDAGGLHTCALFQNEEVRCWGNNTQGQVGDGTLTNRHMPEVIFGSGSGVDRLDLGGFHSCAIFESGGLKCWGDNWAGQLGDGTNDDRLGPTTVPALQSGVAALAGGDSHSCAVLSDGRALCWGSNSFGQLGDTNGALRLAPVPVVGLGGVPDGISAGELHACALTAAGGVRCWGNNTYGQLGDGTFTDRLSAVSVSGLASGVLAVESGGYHTCALLAGGGVKCWGNNGKGQLGNASEVNSHVPVDVAGLSSGVSELALGLEHSCALLSAGGVKCWGSNWAGQLGNDSNTLRRTPVDVIGLPAVSTALTAGQDHACAITSLGSLKCWGYNFNGQLGNGGSSNQWTPVTVSGMGSGAGVTAVSAGSFHTCALADGVLQCWGGNFSGQVGDGTVDTRYTPVPVLGLASGVSLFDSGVYHTCALLDTGAVQCWGDNWAGQLGDGTTTPRPLPQTASGLTGTVSGLTGGAHFSCAWTGSGGQCWGAHGNGQIGDGTLPWRTSPADVVGLIPAQLSINYPSGKPGSSFTLTGTHFTPGLASVSVNGSVLGTDVPIDGQGQLSVLLATDLADPGDYFVTVQASEITLVPFVLDLAAPLRLPSGSGYLFDVPAGIAFDHRATLSMAALNIP